MGLLVKKQIQITSNKVLNFELIDSLKNLKITSWINEILDTSNIGLTLQRTNTLFSYHFCAILIIAFSQKVNHDHEKIQ